MTDANKAMSPQHFGSNPMDIQMRINPEMRITCRILDHFWLIFWPWLRFALSECSFIKGDVMLWSLGSCSLPVRL